MAPVESRTDIKLQISTFANVPTYEISGQILDTIVDKVEALDSVQRALERHKI